MLVIADFRLLLLGGSEMAGWRRTVFRGSASAKRSREHEQQIQRERFRRTSIQSNAEMSTRHMRRYCELGPSSRRLLEHAVARLGLSARAYARLLKVARTIADLAACERLNSAHVAEAVHYRALDKAYFRAG